jgi:NAD(P)H-dependent FMN reductase
MSKKILAIGTTNQASSINRQLSVFAATLLNEWGCHHVDMRECEMPIFGSDRHEEQGIPQVAIDFREKMKGFDGFIVSLAEHNGNYTAVFKNLIDWLSVQEGKVWQGKPVLLLSTSPGSRGAINVLGIAENYFPHMGAKVTGSFSLGSFHDTFEEGRGITDQEKLAELRGKVADFEAAVLST